MKYRLIVTVEAQQEETDAYNYYEEIRLGLGEELLSELGKCYNKIVTNPTHYSYIGTSAVLRDIRVNRFPYLVIYLVADGIVSVLSVRNTYRTPFLG